MEVVPIREMGRNIRTAATTFTREIEGLWKMRTWQDLRTATDSDMPPAFDAPCGVNPTKETGAGTS
jgi:hypothetical protein